MLWAVGAAVTAATSRGDGFCCCIAITMVMKGAAKRRMRQRQLRSRPNINIKRHLDRRMPLVFENALEDTDHKSAQKRRSRSADDFRRRQPLFTGGEWHLSNTGDQYQITSSVGLAVHLKAWRRGLHKSPISIIYFLPGYFPRYGSPNINQ